MKIAIAGMGLIGGSLYKAATAKGYDVIGIDKNDTVQIDDADVIFVALHPAIAIDWILKYKETIKAGAIVVDTCGIKGSICEALEEEASKSNWTFIGGHPMAGKEVSGFENSDANLFKGASMILTPYQNTGADKLEIIKALLKELGFGKIVITDASEHDTMIAYTSQLCHIISSAYLRDERSARHDGYSAGSFRDLTRVGAPDPNLWSELFLDNSSALLPVIDGFIKRMEDFRQAIATGNRQGLISQLAEGVEAKKQMQKPHLADEELKQ